MDKYIIVFCEGDHDIAFLSRILQVYGFSVYNEKVEDFTKPFDKLYIEALSKSVKIKERRFEFQRPDKQVPYSVLNKDNTLIIFHNMGGDGSIEKYSQEVVHKYIQLNDEMIREVQGYDKLDYRFLYFLDADDEGVTSRLVEMNNLLSFVNNELKHCNIEQKEDYEVGCYIFHDIEHTKLHGKLENLLLDLMTPKNEEIFKKSSEFLEQNILDNSRQRRFVCTYEKEEPKGSIQFKKEKSQISIAGQLQFSGASNSVIIANSDYIKRNDILNSQVCKNIMELFA